jgi:hypothetical protein
MVREQARQGSNYRTRPAFNGLAPCRIAIEVGGNSPLVSRLLTELGHEVIVANARKVQLISTSSKKDDRMAPFVESIPEHGYQGKATPREIYRDGLRDLGDFTVLEPARQDEKLQATLKTFFFSLAAYPHNRRFSL